MFCSELLINPYVIYGHEIHAMHPRSCTSSHLFVEEKPNANLFPPPPFHFSLSIPPSSPAPDLFPVPPTVDVLTLVRSRRCAPHHYPKLPLFRPTRTTSNPLNIVNQRHLNINAPGRRMPRSFGSFRHCPCLASAWVSRSATPHPPFVFSSAFSP